MSFELSAALAEKNHDLKEVGYDTEITEAIDPPKAPLKSHLPLTGTQERKLVDLVLKRLEESISSQKFRRMESSNSWLERRNEAMRQYGSDFSTRVEAGTIYEFSNLSMNLPKRYCDITCARAFDELLGSEQLLGVTQEGAEDSKEEASAIERFGSHKLKEVRIKEVLREATLGACIRGESVVKTTWEKQYLRYRKTCHVLTDEVGRFVFASDGNPVTNTDPMFEGEDGVTRLSRDEKIRIPENPTYKETVAEFRRVVKSGLDVVCLDHRDFVCNTAEKDIHEADFCAHVFDWPSDKVRGVLAGVLDTENAKLFLQKLGRGNVSHITGGAWASQPDDLKGEQERDMDAIPLHQFAECYIRCCVSEDGGTDEIMVVVDVDNKQALFYDYLGNVSPTGKRPFQVVRVNPVPGRWYGTGFYEKFQDRHKFVDLFFNRVNFRSSLSGNIRIENPEATEEGMAGEEIEFGTNKTYKLRPGFKIKDVFQVIQVPNDATESKDMLNLLLQTTQLEAGMVSAGDAGIGSLPSAGLATGIKSLDRVANIVLKSIFFDLVQGFERILFDAVTVVLAKYDTSDAISMMGVKKAEMLEKCRDIYSLPYRVKVVLSNARDIDVIKANSQAMEVVGNYLNLAPQIAIRIRPLFIQMLESLQISGVEDLLPIPEVTGSPANEQGEAQEAGAALAESGGKQQQRGSSRVGEMPSLSAGMAQAELGAQQQESMEQEPQEVNAQNTPTSAIGISAAAPAAAEVPIGDEEAGSSAPPVIQGEA